MQLNLKIISKIFIRKFNFSICFREKTFKMPPKKDKGKKGKGKKEKKEKEEKEPPLEVVDENTRQFFLLQIKDLEEKLKRFLS